MPNHVNPDSTKVNIIKTNGTDGWERECGSDAPTITDVLDRNFEQSPGLHVLFFPRDITVETLVDNEDPLIVQFSKRFHMPEFFWTWNGWNANGFYRSTFETVNGFGSPGFTTSYRFLIKQVNIVPTLGPSRTLTGEFTGQSRGQKIEYSWVFLGLHSLWLTKGDTEKDLKHPTQVLLCFDFDEQTSSDIQTRFTQASPEQLNDGPFATHAVFLDALVRAYDNSLWGFRTPVRDIEKKRISFFEKQDEGLPARFENMHELQRHIIHASETLNVAAMVINSMEEDFKKYAESLAVFLSAPSMRWDNNVGSLFRFYSKFINALNQRANAFEGRLQNEIRLAFNTLSIRNNTISVKSLEQLERQNESSSESLKQLQKQNSSLASVLSILTLIFLPGSFISGFFGTNFFSITAGANGSPAWVYVKELWIFWACTIPVTLISIVLWLVFRKGSNKNSGTKSLEDKLE